MFFFLSFFQSVSCLLNVFQLKQYSTHAVISGVGYRSRYTVPHMDLL